MGFLAPWALLAAIVLIVLAGHLLQRRRIGRC